MACQETPRAPAPIWRLPCGCLNPSAILPKGFSCDPFHHCRLLPCQIFRLPQPSASESPATVLAAERGKAPRGKPKANSAARRNIDDPKGNRRPTLAARLQREKPEFYRGFLHAGPRSPRGSRGNGQSSIRLTARYRHVMSDNADCRSPVSVESVAIPFQKACESCHKLSNAHEPARRTPRSHDQNVMDARPDALGGLLVRRFCERCQMASGFLPSNREPLANWLREPCWTASCGARGVGGGGAVRRCHPRFGIVSQ